MEGKKTNPIFADDKVQTAFPTDCSHAILYRRLKLRYFFRSLKIEGCYRHIRRISYAVSALWGTW